MRRVLLAFVIAIIPAMSVEAESVRSQSTNVWSSINECWATPSPTVSMFVDDFGLSKTVQTSPYGIVEQVGDINSGVVLVTFGCTRMPSSDPAAFQRFTEISE